MILDNPKDLSQNFYSYLLNKSRSNREHRVLILCATDVDAVCAVKILLHLFNCDYILYSLTICSNFTDCIKAVKPVRETVRSIVMINCGAAEDVYGRLKANKDARYFILDSRLPVHLHNLYSGKAVRVLRKVDASEIPAFDSVFSQEEDEPPKKRAKTDSSINGDDDDTMSQSSEMSGNSQVENIRERREKERKKAEWEVNRKIIESNYYKNVSYEDSSAMKMFELAHLISKDDHNLFFWAIIGLCDMFVQRKISSSEFVKVRLSKLKLVKQPKCAT